VGDHGFEPRSGQTKDYKIGICCFSSKQAALRRKSKDWLSRNQDNASKWGDMSIHELLFQWASTIKNLTKHVGLVQSGHHHHLIEN
jgi:predicted LPLAT superfamily acyltransferase